MAGFRLLLTTSNNKDLSDYTSTLCKELISTYNAQIFLVVIDNNLKNFKEIDHGNIKYIYLSEDYNGSRNEKEFEDVCERIKNFLECIVEDFSPDIVHLNHYLGKTELGSPTLLVTHKPFIKSEYQYNKLIADSLNSANKIIVSAQITAKKIFQSYKPNKKMNLIYNGIPPIPSKIESNTPCILTEMNFQNEENLLKKISYKLPENIKIFVLNGNKQYFAGNRNIKTITAKEFLTSYHNNSIYLTLSNGETSGLTSLKAAALNCAIVSNDNPFLKELWYDSGIFYKKNDLNSLLREINNLMENKNLLSKISQKCKMKALTSFTSKRMAFEYVNLYKQTLLESRYS